MATGVEDTVHIRLVADNTLRGLDKVVGRAGLWSGDAGVRSAGASKSDRRLTRVHSKDLDLLSNTIDVYEGSGGQGDVSVEQNSLGTTIH